MLYLSTNNIPMFPIHKAMNGNASIGNIGMVLFPMSQNFMGENVFKFVSKDIGIMNSFRSQRYFLGR